MAPDDAKVEVKALRRLLTALFERVGMSHGDAAVVADCLVHADVCGVASHGSAMAGTYLDALRRGHIDPRGRPYLVHDGGSCSVVDGDNAMGHVGATFTMRTAVERASEAGVSAIALRGSNHCGAAGTYARIALEAGMFGLVFLTSIPTMAPPGGSVRTLGMNPIAIAVPGEEDPPVVLDMAFALGARGRILQQARQGAPLPQGWAVDAEGVPTTDPRRALDGLLQPIGGYKGAGLAVAFGLLATAFGGAAMGPPLGSFEEGAAHGRDGLLALAINPGAFGDAATVRRRVDESTAALRTSIRVSAATVSLPGDRAAQSRHRAAREGVPLDVETRDTLRSWCERLHVDTAPIARQA